MMDDNFKNALIKSYIENGEFVFYKKMLSSAVKKTSFLIKEKSNQSFPDKELLDIYNFFLQHYRRSGDEIYLDVAKVCRKAAHKIHRVLLKQHLVKKSRDFLNLV